MRAATIFCLLTLASAALAQQENDDLYTPARFLSGKTPEQPPLAAAGGVTILEIDVAASGIITDAVVLAEAEPYTEALRSATTLWRFRPAKEDGEAIASKVLIMGVFRPPVLMGGGLPEPKSVRRPSDGVAYPTGPVVGPEYPPNALFEGVAVVEVEIDSSGEVAFAELLSPEQGFDEAAIDAATQTRFRAARHNGAPVSSFALIFFGFAQPLTSPRLPRR